MNTLQPETQPKIASAMAETLIGSEIIRIAGEVNEKIKQGEKVFNMTIGDFDPKVFPIPNALLEEIKFRHLRSMRRCHANFFPDSNDPNTQIVTSISINPFRGFNDWLTCAAIASNKLYRFRKCFIVGSLTHQRKESFGVFDQLT
jgi:hypothetical protein